MLTVRSPSSDVFKEQIKLDETKDDPGTGNLHFVQFDFTGPFAAILSYRNDGGLHISRTSLPCCLPSSSPYHMVETDNPQPMQSKKS